MKQTSSCSGLTSGPSSAKQMKPNISNRGGQSNGNTLQYSNPAVNTRLVKQIMFSYWWECQSCWPLTQWSFLTQCVVVLLNKSSEVCFSQCWWVSTWDYCTSFLMQFYSVWDMSSWFFELLHLRRYIILQGLWLMHQQFEQRARKITTTDAATQGMSHIESSVCASFNKILTITICLDMFLGQHKATYMRPESCLNWCCISHR